jgi:DNA-binding NarL/FixJ family response regulator
MPKSIRVVVIEDNRLVREAIAAMLAEQPDLEVVAAGECADAALRQAREAHARVVLLDAGLGDHDSHRLVATVKRMAPDARIIVMDVLPVPEDVVEFIKAGASGFIAKDATRDDFVGAVRSVAAGTEVLPSALTGTLFSHIAKRANGLGAPDAIDAGRMTRREREVLQLITDGLSNKEIGDRLHITANTVKGHVHNILEKMALRSRLQIAAHIRRCENSPRLP